MILSVVVLGAMMVSCNKTAPASEQKEEITTPANPHVSAIRIANELAAYGYENESATALFEAVIIYASADKAVLDSEKETDAQEECTEDKENAKSYKPEDVLAAGMRLAGDDETLLALGARAQKALEESLTRGAVNGPKYAYTRVMAHSSDLYRVNFYAGQTAEVAVSGDHDTDLDLYIYDENGNLIVSDTDYTDQCYVRWCPRWTGTFAIKIVNRGGVYNQYALVTN